MHDLQHLDNFQRITQTMQWGNQSTYTVPIKCSSSLLLPFRTNAHSWWDPFSWYSAASLLFAAIYFTNSVEHELHYTVYAHPKTGAFKWIASSSMHHPFKWCGVSYGKSMPSSTKHQTYETPGWFTSIASTTNWQYIHSPKFQSPNPVRCSLLNFTENHYCLTHIRSTLINILLNSIITPVKR